jgi:hypothetical protein
MGKFQFRGVIGSLLDAFKMNIFPKITILPVNREYYKLCSDRSHMPVILSNIDLL